MTDYKALKAGDSFTSSRGREGTLLTKPEYRTNYNSGLFYSDVEWKDGRITKDFMICLVGLEWTKK